jgi:hypothetical protein
MKNLKIIVLIVSMFAVSCTTQRESIDLSSKPRKEVTGAFCQLVMPPVQVTLEAGGSTKKTFYYFLGKNSCHSFLEQRVNDKCEEVKWYLCVTEDAEIFNILSKLTPEQVGLLTVAEIPPLTNYYDEVIKNSPSELKQKLEDMNGYRVYQIFGKMVAPRQLAGAEYKAPNSSRNPQPAPTAPDQTGTKFGPRK